MEFLNHNDLRRIEPVLKNFGHVYSLCQYRFIEKIPHQIFHRRVDSVGNMGEKSVKIQGGSKIKQS